MACCHHYQFIQGNEQIFAVDPTAIRFGPGALKEIGHDANELSLKRVAVFTDKGVGGLEAVDAVKKALSKSGVEFELYDEVRVEPTDQSFIAASKFASEGDFDGYVSIGGGSVIDSAKAANLYATYPADFLAYVNAPIGEGRPVPGPLKPHIACPTTSGTGSECTGIAVFDLLSKHVKTGIASKRLRPSLALIDPTVTATLPTNVVAASGFDVLCHALESYTASPFTRRKAPEKPGSRPMSQGANPWSDVGCVEALKRTGEFLVRAVRDSTDQEARHGMMYAATLAGIAFGNSGVHLPHGMAYSVAGMIRDYRPDGYPGDEAICPHGISVIVDAPSVFRHTAPADPARHLESAGFLGADLRNAGEDDAGEILAGRIIEMMRATEMPNGLKDLGYGEADIPGLTDGAWAQQRLLANSPVEVSPEVLAGLYRSAHSYW
ncbi:MAG: iron-containing alcohol dehydrogenase [Gammaproteobacteria bacterium]|nr:iron-containing alcohol dehydrogenase [Gammaproteobacteria bacterium]MDH3411804.1 iron-containing alcohol dehydrogenase [Gammaproteobacteria bacterium]